MGLIRQPGLCTTCFFRESSRVSTDTWTPPGPGPALQVLKGHRARMQPTMTPGISQMTIQGGSRLALSPGGRKPALLCVGSWPLLLPTVFFVSRGLLLWTGPTLPAKFLQPHCAHGSSPRALRVQQSPLPSRTELWILSKSKSALLDAWTTNLNTHLWPLISPDKHSLSSLRSARTREV